MLYSIVMKLEINEIVEKYKVPNLVRAFDVFEEIGHNGAEGLSIAELAKRLDYPKNSIFRITMSLYALGYVDRDPASKRFFLTKRLLSLGSLAIHEQSLVEQSIDIMRELRDKTKESVFLGVLIDDHVLLMEQVSSLYPFKFSITLGSRILLHTSAPGKALVANLPNSERDALIEKIEYKTYTDNTINNKADFDKELKQVRKLGYSIDRAEELIGVHCVGAPIFNNNNFPIAAIWVTGPAARIEEASFPELGEVVKEAAKKISIRFGYNNIAKEKCLFGLSDDELNE